MDYLKNLLNKKLLILGGNPETGNLVNVANSLGIHTIVADPNPKSPAKEFAKNYYNVDGFDILKLKEISMKEKVDGVLVGVADILVKPYYELCKALRLPCYANISIIKAFSSKDGFSKICKNYNIKTTPSYVLDSDFRKQDLNNIKYPVMVKPVDNGGGVGMSICLNEKELFSGVKNSIYYSRKKLFQVEKYMQCDDIVAYYTFQDGEIFLSAIADRIKTKKQGSSSPVCLASVYPSKHCEDYINITNPLMINMFKSIGISNGVLAIQFFVENDNFYAYDPGFRLQGEAMHIYIDKINGFDHRKMLINFALTGSMGIKNLAKKNDFLFNGMKCCTLWILLKEGIIKNIYGIKNLKEDSSVIFIIQRFKIGDRVTKNMVGNEKQVLARIYIISETKKGLASKINSIQKKISVIDVDGNEMVVDRLDTELI